jgi:hypothetical protein
LTAAYGFSVAAWITLKLISMLGSVAFGGVKTLETFEYIRNCFHLIPFNITGHFLEHFAIVIVRTQKLFKEDTELRGNEIRRKMSKNKVKFVSFAQSLSNLNLAARSMTKKSADMLNKSTKPINAAVDSGAALQGAKFMIIPEEQSEAVL